MKITPHRKHNNWLMEFTRDNLNRFAAIIYLVGHCIRNSQQVSEETYAYSVNRPLFGSSRKIQNWKVDIYTLSLKQVSGSAPVKPRTVIPPL